MSELRGVWAKASPGNRFTPDRCVSRRADTMQGSRGFRRGSWQCHIGCKLPNKDEKQAFDGSVNRYIEPEEMFVPPIHLQMRA